jgi:hypothetical protein
MNDISRLSNLIRNADFPTFGRWVFALLTGDPRLHDPYVALVLEHMRSFLDGGCNKSVVNLPPRHGKTIFCTVAPIAWILGHEPDRDIILACYGDDLAEYITEQILTVIQAPAFQNAFSARVSRKTRGEFAMVQGGRLFASSIDGRIQGRGADYVFLDDPNRIEGANSVDQLAHVNRLYDGKIASRVNDLSKGRIALAGHRVNEGDLTGHVLASGGFRQLVLHSSPTRRRPIA